MDAKAFARLESYICVGYGGSCWIWTGYAGRAGYGQIRVGGRNRPVHRAAYEYLVGPVPGGLHLDHLCRQPLCCNPAHLEPVTPAENTRRSPIAPATINAAKKFCVRGHDLSVARVARKGSRVSRICRTCARDHMRIWRNENRDAVRAADREQKRAAYAANPEKYRAIARERRRAAKPTARPHPV